MSSKNNPLLKEFYQRQLEIRERAYKARILPALYDAIYLCNQAEILPPTWIMKGMLATMEKLFAGKFAEGVGRTANPKAKYAADLKHYIRWDTVDEIREYHQSAWAEHRAALKNPKFSKKTKARFKANPPDNLGETWEDVYDHASELLKGTTAVGSPETVRKSYFLVKRAMRDPSQAMRFYLADPGTRKKLGIER